MDERLIAMQEAKKEIIRGAMDDRSVMKQLSLSDLLQLFGPVAYKENNQPFILVDDDAKIYRNTTQQPDNCEDI